MDGKGLIQITYVHVSNHVFSVMLMLYDLEVLQSDSDRIGEPVALPLTDIINGGGSSNRLGMSPIKYCIAI